MSGATVNCFFHCNSRNNNLIVNKYFYSIYISNFTYTKTDNFLRKNVYLFQNKINNLQLLLLIIVNWLFLYGSDFFDTLHRLGYFYDRKEKE